MTDKKIKGIEEFLIPFALSRYDFDSIPTGIFFKTTDGNAIASIEDYIKWIVRAVVRCLVSSFGKICLSDIVTIAMSEAYVMMNFTPMHNIHRQSLESIAGEKILLENEIHTWLLHLQKNERLPGKYERFTGMFINERTKK